MELRHTKDWIKYAIYELDDDIDIDIEQASDYEKKEYLIKLINNLTY